MTLEAGAIVLVPFPYSNLRATKRRPAVVLSRREHNDRSQDVVVCAMTSDLANAGNSVLVSQRDLADGRLPADSRVKVDKLATLDKSMMRAVGRLRPSTLRQVYRELLSLLPAEASA